MLTNAFSIGIHISLSIEFYGLNRNLLKNCKKDENFVFKMCPKCDFCNQNVTFLGYILDTFKNVTFLDAFWPYFLAEDIVNSNAILVL